MGKINDSAPAPRDGAAAAGVRVGAGTGPAVVVRRAAPGAGHGVPLQRPVADVAARRQDAPVRLRVQIELPLAVAARRQALGYRPLAARSAAAAGPPQAEARRLARTRAEIMKRQDRGDGEKMLAISTVLFGFWVSAWTSERAVS